MEQKTVKKIDIHVHSVAFHSCPRLDGSDYTTPDELREIYDKIGVEKGVQLPGTNPEGMSRIYTNEDAMQLVKDHPETYYWFCNIDPRFGHNAPDTDLSFFINYYKTKIWNRCKDSRTRTNYYTGFFMHYTMPFRKSLRRSEP